MTATPDRLLVVCLGNHCRSPLAEAVLTQKSGGALDVRSAGTAGKWSRRPAHATMTAVAARHGYDLSAHRGQQVTPELLAWADAVLAMDAKNLTDLKPLTIQTSTTAVLYLGDRDVPDPWGGDEEAFTACLRIIEAGAARHLP
ncbi:protein tyrosine phosphatase [Parafrankia sp. EAN1pec]|uniref:low molecular weight protein-tyrosine-phosphatase n=1 Tax=Parafrankia sp. (strain EAN1pec) TaxID=298653 RepID=UPI00005440AC|nr:protein tyrosine phosphatase [Frankia sp. EAN1pec]